MPNFDFHNNLSAIEFERLVRDMLQQKYKGYTFRSYKAGKDGGIDIKSMGGSKMIICQTKLYQQNFSQLQRSLQKELIKVQKLKPQRYILATSCSLTNENIQAILNDFSGINLKEEDIWDKERLNQMLGLPEFKEVLKNHFKLFLTDLVVLEEIFRKTINNAIIQYSLIELEQIRNEIRYYVETKSIGEIQQKLLKERVVIISGSAGTGKTTAARMIINSLLNTNKSIEFFKTTAIDETLSTFDPTRNQIFLLDDYWGQFIEKIHEPNTAKSDKLLTFLERVKRSNKHYVIITSRDYILKDEGILKQVSLKNIINKHLFTIHIKEFTDQEKAYIFIQHLYHSDFDRNFLSYLYKGDELKRVVKHRNFNPRLINQFIYQVFPRELLENKYEYRSHYFYINLKNYLDNPDEYWEHLLNVQTDSGKLVLMILVTTERSSTYKQLLFTFERCLPLAISKGYQVKISDFISTIKTLEDTFIDILELGYDNVDIKFKNGSIGDYLITYLKNNLTNWCSILIKGAVFFNQLTTIFIAQKSIARKVGLIGRYQSELKERLLQELLVLPNEIADLAKEKFIAEDEVVYRLLILTEIFIIHEESDVLEYLIKKVNDLLAFQKDYHYHFVSFFRNNLPLYPSLIQILQPFILFDVNEFLKSIFFSIQRFEDYEYFIKFSAAYPEEFRIFIINYRKSIRRQVEIVLIEDIEHFHTVQREYLNNLIEYRYRLVFKGLGLKHTRKFNNEVFAMFGINISSLMYPKKTDNSIRISRPRKERKKEVVNSKRPFAEILKQYIAEEEQEQYITFSSLLEMETYHASIVLKFILINPHLSEQAIEFLLQQISFDSKCHNRLWFTQNELKRKLLEFQGNIIEQLDLSALLIQQEKWYKLPNGNYADYLAAFHCNNINNNDQYEKAIIDLFSSLDTVEMEQAILIHLQINEERFFGYFIKKILHEIFLKVDLTFVNKKVQSFSSVMGWHVDVYFKKYRGTIREIESLGGGNTNIILKALSKIVMENNLNFEYDEILDYLNKQIENNPVLVARFENYCRKHLVVSHRLDLPKEYEYFDLDLGKHLKNMEFWEIAEESGWVNAISKAINSLLEYKITLDKKYNSHN